MSLVREGFLEAARSGADLLAQPQVREAWGGPSALAEFSVSGLSGHLANQVFTATAVIDREPLDESPIPLLQHYLRASWVNSGIDSEVNTQIRATGKEVAGEDVDDLVRRMGDAIEAMSRRIPREPEDRVVNVGGRWNLRLDDYLVTRMMELAVHADDLAFSVGLPTPALPPMVLDPVLDLLTKLSLHKHGQAALLRALTRSERAPADITAF